MPHRQGGRCSVGAGDQSGVLENRHLSDKYTWKTLKDNGNLNRFIDFLDDVRMLSIYRLLLGAFRGKNEDCRIGALLPIFASSVAQSRWFDEHLMAGGPCKAFCNGARKYADTIFRRLTLLIWLALLHPFFWFQRWTSAVVTCDTDPEPSMLHSLRSSCSSWGWKGSVLPYSALFAMPSTIATVSGRVGKWSILSMLSWRKGSYCVDLLVFVKDPWWAAAWVSPHNAFGSVLRATRRNACALEEPAGSRTGVRLYNLNDAKGQKAAPT